MVDFKSGITFIQKIFKERFKKNGIYIDATCGNGYDSLFLAKELQGTGHLFCFDIQQLAIDVTEILLLHETQYGIKNVTFILDSHAYFHSYIKEPVDGILYKLGYLPSGDKSLTIQSSSTVESLRQGLAILKTGGLIGIMVYNGHAGGSEEEYAITEFLSTLSQKEYHIIVLRHLNRPTDSSYPIVIEKIKDELL